MKNNLLLIPVAALGLAVLPLPYFYYVLLRFVVPAFALYLAHLHSEGAKKLTGWTLAFLFIAVLWNPILPIHLDRGGWFVLDLAAAFVFWYAWQDSAKLSPEADGNKPPQDAG